MWPEIERASGPPRNPPRVRSFILSGGNLARPKRFEHLPPDSQALESSRPVTARSALSFEDIEVRLRVKHECYRNLWSLRITRREYSMHDHLWLRIFYSAIGLYQPSYPYFESSTARDCSQDAGIAMFFGR